MSEEANKAKLIKDALKIVDTLGKFDIDDMSGEDKENLEELVEKAKKLRNNRLFVLN